MGTPAEFQKNARECIELAERETKARYRDMLLRLANKWLELADQAQREAEWKADGRDNSR